MKRMMDDFFYEDKRTNATKLKELGRSITLGIAFVALFVGAFAVVIFVVIATVKAVLGICG